MKDMKMSPMERVETAPTVLDEAEYPYGLRISLDEQSLQKINFTTLPGIGDTMIITARVKVTDVSANETDDGVRRSVGLQITDLEFGPDNEDKNEEGATTDDLARKLFGDQNTVMAPPSHGQLYR